MTPDSDKKTPPPACVVLVGHCGFDSGSLTRTAKQAVPDTPIQRVNRRTDLEPFLRTGNLLLVNRVLDGTFGTGDGVSLITELTARPDPPAMLLVSNYPDAQADAERAGAWPGFGKSDLEREQTRRRIAAALGAAARPEA